MFWVGVLCDERFVFVSLLVLLLAGVAAVAPHINCLTSSLVLVMFWQVIATFFNAEILSVSVIAKHLLAYFAGGLILHQCGWAERVAFIEMFLATEDCFIHGGIVDTFLQFFSAPRNAPHRKPILAVTAICPLDVGFLRFFT